MSSKQAVVLAETRLIEAPKVPALSSAHAGANCNGKAMPGASLIPGGTAPGGF